MLNFEFFRQKSPSQRFLFILGLFMLLVYIVLGVTVIFFDEYLPLEMSKTLRVAFGLLLIVYASIRFSRLVKKPDDEI